MKNRQDVTLRIATETPQSELVGLLAAELDRLGKEGGKVGPRFKKLAADIREMEAASGKAQGVLGRMRGALSGVAEEARKLPAMLGKITGFLGLGGAGLAGGLLAVAQSAATTADDMGKLAQRTGTTTEAISRLVYAAGLGDASANDLEMGFKSLSERMLDAANGGKQSSAMFQRLGISVKNTDGTLRSVDEVFLDLADRFKGMPDGAEKTALAVDMLSRSGLALIPTLNAGSEGLRALGEESDRFGKTITKEAAARAEQFNDNLSRLQAVMKGLSQEIGIAAVPALNLLAQAFLDASADQGKLVAGDGIESWATRGARAVGFLVDMLDGAARGVEIVGIGLGAYGAMAVEVAKGNVKAAKAIYAELNRDVDAILQRKQFSTRIDDQIDAAPEQAREAAAKKAADAEREQASKLVALETRLAAERVRLAQLTAGEIISSSGDIAKDDAERTKQQIKNAETLKDALQKAWESSREGARKAGEEAATLFQNAADAQASRQKQAQDRRDKSLTPEEAESKNRNRATTLTDEASRQATFAQNAAIDGRAKDAQRYAEKALQLSKEAADYAGRVQDDGTAARLLEQIGAAEKAAIESQAKVKQSEAAAFEQTAEAQLAKIREIDAELSKIKQVQIEVETAAAQATVVALQAQIDAMKDKTVTITVAQAGPVIDATAENVLGSVTKRAFGGPLPGVAANDRADNMIYRGTPGEWVIQRPAVRMWGDDNMRRINRGQMPRYAYGGEIGQPSMAQRVSIPSVDSNAGRPAAGTPITLQWPDGTTAQVSAEQSVADQIVKTFRRAALARGGRK